MALHPWAGTGIGDLGARGWLRRRGLAAAAVEPPVRSVLFGQARFEQHGRSLAATHEVRRRRRRSDELFFPRLDDNLKVLRAVRAVFERQAREGMHLGPAVDWLLDNAALLDEQVVTIRRRLPLGFYRELPQLRDAPLAGLPRIYGVAWAWVAHTDSGLDTALLEAYLVAYQQERALTLAELWALPTTLRVVLVENLRRLAERIAVVQLARDAAHRWIDQPDDRHTVGALDALVETMAWPGAVEAFALQLSQRCDELPPAQSHRLAQWIAERLPDPAAALARQQAESTEDHQSIRNAITTLRALDDTDWRGLLERSCAVMRLLATLPVYAAEAEDTRDQTLHAVERLARRAERPEIDVAQAIATHCRAAVSPDDPAAAPAWWWCGPGRRGLYRELGLHAPFWPEAGSARRRRFATAGYLGVLGLLTALGVTRLVAHGADPQAPPALLWLAALLLLGPVSEAVVAMANRLIAESVPPQRLPRLALAGGIPEAQRVLVVVPCMLGSTEGVAALCRQLEQHALANPEPNAQFALLSDFADADAADLPGDAALLAAALDAVQALNAAYPPIDAATGGEAPPRFLLLHRRRVWSDTEQRFIGWERKRGKLEQLARLLAEGGDSPFIDLGPASRPVPVTPHLVTLDADTDMPPGRLRALVGVAAHPLNRPRVDAAARRVVAGYGILQPRLVTPLPAPDAVTPFHALFAGRCGIDSYSAATSEIYQDVFGEGSFTGKGLLNVAAVHAVLGGRLPEGRVLSHDLLEGALARCAVVSDLTLVEDAPMHADVAASRVHRWARGDWQLLPFLRRAALPGVPLISRWKMVDNLRRTLVAPLSLALVLLVLATGVLPLGATLAVVAAAFAGGPLLGALAALAPSRDDIALRRFFALAAGGLGRVAALAAWHLAMLLELAWLHADATARALYRQAVSHRGLLQWTTAAQAEAAARHDLAGLWRAHRRTPASALVLGALLAGGAALGLPVQSGAAAVLLTLWALSPLWIAWASRPGRGVHGVRGEALAAEDRAWLLGLARDTWRFYERHVTEAEHHLPPDNVQKLPHTLVAHRTSPTNIGLYLLAAAGARALGFIGSAELADRLERTLATLERLPRHHGHWFNWIDTRTLDVLPPGYVSTVDSGNLSGLLLATAQACLAWAGAVPGAADTLRPAQQALALSRKRLKPLRPLLQGLGSTGTLLALTAAGDTADWPPPPPAIGPLRTRLDAARQELDTLPLPGNGADEAGDDSSLWLLHDHVAMLDSALADLEADPAATAARLRALAARCRALAVAPDYAPLYDRRRKLLHIGWRTDAHQPDENHYDLLASEARLTSLLAIAKGDVPPEHWAALGRPFFAWGTEVGLKSWSGSMFEYLMPSLLLDEPEGSALAAATRAAVALQRDEGRAAGTPWGVSESAIAGQDHTLAYQYGPQGVATLALRRAPPDERVVAPYAAALALRVAPRAALDNLRALQALGARRSLGFIEALDYTPQRQDGGTRARGFVPVHTFMAHHQAMSLLAMAEVLADGAPRRWAMADPLLRAVAPLLHEPLPREVAPLRASPPALPPRRTRSVRRVLDVDPLAPGLPATQLLSNGRQAVVLRDHGGGWSSWQGTGLSRWRDDLLRDAHGHWQWLRRGADEPWRSTTARPAPDPAARYATRLQPDRAEFDARWSDLHVRTTVWVSAEDDCELRDVVLANTGTRPITLQLVSGFEATLAPLRADEAHPAFSDLFVQARWQPAEHALYLQRRPRLPDEATLRAVHFLAASEGAVGPARPLADRARWWGRLGSAAQPRGDGDAVLLADAEPAVDGEGGDPLPGIALDTGLDPMAGLALQVHLPPGESARLVFGTAAGPRADALAQLVDKYRHPGHVARSASMAHTMAGIRLREWQLDADDWAALLRVNTLLTAVGTRDAPLPQRPGSAARCDRRVLWRHGISGDRPIVLVTVAGEPGVALVQTLKRALRMWTAAGLGVDVVALNAEPASYLAPVHHQLQVLRERLALQLEGQGTPASRGSLVVLSDAALDADERLTLAALARLRLVADGRPLAQHVERLADDAAREQRQRRALARLPVEPALADAPAPLPVRAPDFRWRDDGERVQFDVDAARHPARPWSQVLANPDFGCIVTECGGGFTWACNSRMHQLTGWSNDALGDGPAEWLLLHDLERRRVWPLGRVLAGASARRVDHGLGFTRMRQRIDDIEVELVWCVDPRERVKQVQVTLRPMPPRPRRLRLVALAEWVMGANRAERLTVSAGTLPPPGDADAAPPAVTATQLDALGGFGGATALLALRPPQPGDLSGTPSTVDMPATRRASDADSAEAFASLAEPEWTADRREFFDAHGRLSLPAVLGRRAGFGRDPCAAVAASATADAQRPLRATLLLAHADTAEAAHALLDRAWGTDPAHRLALQRAHWRARNAPVRVATPDADLDALVNHWLPYQTLACRLWARAGFYQAGGAFGFRDQLQDAMALADRDPALLAAQIRLHAGRQFAAGDVQHWWHEPGGAGVRTHFSDDLLWLPLACAHWVRRTGDASLLDEPVPFLEGGTIPDGAEDLYETPRHGLEAAPIYEHAARAIDRSLRVGAHGLPLFGTGDWNDGMNRVGHQGRGESVWLAWFLCAVVDAMLPLAEARGDVRRTQAWRQARAGWVAALDADGWDGRWYRRGFFDDGSPLGTAANTEARIDLIAQAWAVLTGAGDPDRARQAMDSAARQLVDRRRGLVRLLDPPLASARPVAGYIQAYPPGVRENGGQYNHGAVWALMAFAKLGDADAAWQVLTMLSPAHRWRVGGRGERYALEPMVMAGDVYTQAPYVGRGGWSWYTGSAGWLLRAVQESLFGLDREGDRVRLSPCLPPHWRDATLTLDVRGRAHRFVVCAGEARAAELLQADGTLRRLAAGTVIDLAAPAAAGAYLVVVPVAADPGPALGTGTAGAAAAAAG